MLSRKSFFATALAFFIASMQDQSVLVNAQYSTTVTLTSYSIESKILATQTLPGTTTLPDALATSTVTVQTTLDPLSVTQLTTLDPVTIQTTLDPVTAQTTLDPVTSVTNLAALTATQTLAPVTTTVTLPAATQTVVDNSCVKYGVNFSGRSCCPTAYIRKKKNTHPHPATPSKTKGKRAVTAEEESEIALAGASREFYPKTVRERFAAGERRAINGPPIATTVPCATSNFASFNTYLGQESFLVTNYNFGNGATMRVQDLYGINVCGDVYIDGAFVASTTCPVKQSGDASYSTNNADDAVNSGKFGYVYVNVPAGVHTVSFKETYSGGQAYYQIASSDQCPALAYIDEQTKTFTNTLYVTSFSTVLPTTTITQLITETSISTPAVITVSETSTPDAVTNTNTPAAVTITNTPAVVMSTVTPAAVTQTVTPSVVTQTVTPSPVIKVVQGACQTQVTTLKCPTYKRQSMLNNWFVSQLKSTKSKNGGQAIDVGCASKPGAYQY